MGAALSEVEERAVQQMICDRHPEQLKMEFALWNRAAVMQLIEREYGIKLTVRGVGNNPKRWGLTHKSRSGEPMSKARMPCKHGYKTYQDKTRWMIIDES